MSDQAPTQPQNEYQRFLRQLPADWERKEVRHLGAIVGGGTPSRDVPSFWRGSIPWVTPGEVSGNATKFLLDTNDHISPSGLAGSGANLLPAKALMVTTRATLGARVINAVPMATNQGFKSIVFKGAEDSDFYFHLFEKVKSELVRRASGTTFLEISGAEFGSIEVPSPDRREKVRITEVLDTLDTATRETEAIIAKLKAVKKGLLHDLLTRGIDTNGELRPTQAEAPHLYKESTLGWIPIEWDVDLVANLTTSSVIGPFGSDLVASDYRESGVPVIFVRDVKPDSLTWKSDVYVSKRKAQALAAHEVLAGDVVATKMGLPPCVAAVYPNTMPNGVVTADIVRLRPNLSRVLSSWMSAFVNSPAVAKQVEQITAGVTRPKVTLRDVRNLRLAIPPLEEQRLLLDRAEAMESHISLEAAALQKFSAEKSGLMDDLLTGRVRVTPLLEPSTP